MSDSLSDNSAPSPDPRGVAFIVDVDGYEGPLDVLLTLARAQKVDLTQISIVQLADQYLGFIVSAKRADLDLAADYLVMAAWLAYLKSRLLLPEAAGEDEPSGESMAEALTFQLRRLEAMRQCGGRLMARNLLGREVFARGEPERLAPVTTTVFAADLNDLLAAYGEHLARQLSEQPLRILPSELYSVEEALYRLRQRLGRGPGWETLWRFLPPGTLDGLNKGSVSAKSAVASTFAACLELAREGELTIRQSGPFGTIYVSSGRREETGE